MNFTKNSIYRIGMVVFDYLYILATIFLVVTSKDFFTDFLGTIFEGAVGEITFYDTLYSLIVYSVWIFVSYYIYKLNKKVFFKK